MGPSISESTATISSICERRTERREKSRCTETKFTPMGSGNAPPGFQSSAAKEKPLVVVGQEGSKLCPKLSWKGRRASNAVPKS